MTDRPGLTKRAIAGTIVVAFAGVVWWLLASTPVAENAGVGEVRAPETRGATSLALPSSSSPIVPRALAESDPVEAPVSRRESLEIEVIGPAGMPATGARAALIREGRKLGRGRTDAQGIVIFGAGEGEADLVLVPTGAPTLRRTISIAAGRQRIELPRGGVIAGIVEVDGAPPAEPLQLFAHSPSMPVLAIEAFAALENDTLPACPVGPLGSFELAGLQDGTAWTFGPRTVGYGFDEILVGGKKVKEVAAPATGVVVRLTRLPIVRGRVVSAGSQTPVARAACEIKMEATSMTMGRRFVADEDGVFRFAAAIEHERSEMVSRIEIVVHGPDPATAKTIVLDPAPERDHDLGDVEIASGRTLAFLVRDPAGAPIEGALARVGREVDLATKTDSEGRGTIRLPESTQEMWVGAARFAVARIPIPAAAAGSEPLLVVLQQCCGIDVTLASRGNVSSSLKVRVTTEGPHPFAKGSRGVDPIHVATGADANHDSSWNDERSEFFFRPSSEGRVRVAGFRCGVRFTVAAIDAVGAVLANETVTLTAGEVRSLRLEITRPERSLRGRVRDPELRPVTGAWAQLSSDPEGLGPAYRGRGGTVQIAVETDREGRFLLSGFHDSEVNLSVVKEGYTPIIHRGFRVPAEGVEVTFDLQPGCRITVEVRQSDGTPIPGLRVWADVEGAATFDAREKEPGSYAIADLQPGAKATVETRWANELWKRAITIKPDLVEVIKMQPTGKIIVDYAGIDGKGLMFGLRKPGAKDDLYGAIISPPAAGAPRVFESDAILPGEYEAVLHVEFGNQPDPAPPQRVTVLGGQSAKISFRKP